MENIIKNLEAKKKYYDSVASMAKKSIESMPVESRLRVSYRNGNPQYYEITQKGDTNGRYISKREKDKIREIAQSEYEKRAYRCAMKWSNAIQSFLKDISYEEIKDIYSNSIGRRKVISPYELTDEEFIQKWKNVEYTSKKFNYDTSEIFSERGERVRSKSEKIIADKLNMLGIPYRYEYPLYLKGLGKVYPDFTLLDIKTRKEIIFEHFGMMDNIEYCNKAINKINYYIKNEYYPGDNLIITYESSVQPLNTNALTDMLNHYFL